MNDLMHQQHSYTVSLLSNIIDLQVKVKSQSAISINIANKIQYITETVKNLGAFVDELKEEIINQYSGKLTETEQEFLDERKLQSKILSELKPLVLLLMLKETTKQLSN